MSDKRIRIFRALGQETRFRIFKLLMRGERCACEIPRLIKRTQSNTSMQLAKLIDSGVISARRDGKKIMYSVRSKTALKMMKR